MAKYIDADRLRAEIESRKEAILSCPENGIVTFEAKCAIRSMAKGLLSFIDSLQQAQPEVDIEKEIDFFLYGIYTPERFPNTMQVRDEHTGLKVNDWKFWPNKPEYKVKFARHFYELGLNARRED